jgi:hypothetical protein
VNADWTAVIMKKNRCPPESNGCEAGKAHLDIAVPGYDNLQFSTANVCGEASRDATFMSKTHSSMCGDWYTRGADTTLGCDCTVLPSTTNEDKRLKRGCELFTAWGWTSGDPGTLSYQSVTCVHLLPVHAFHFHLFRPILYRARAGSGHCALTIRAVCIPPSPLSVTDAPQRSLRSLAARSARGESPPRSPRRPHSRRRRHPPRLQEVRSPHATATIRASFAPVLPCPAYPCSPEHVATFPPLTPSLRPCATRHPHPHLA